MKLLLDQNLSFRLLEVICAEFPDSTQVAQVGLDKADDTALWRHARDNGYAIVTKDSDFQELSVFYGSPPKVVWIRCGNSSTAFLRQLFVDRCAEIKAFLNAADVDVLEIY